MCRLQILNNSLDFVQLLELSSGAWYHCVVTHSVSKSVILYGRAVGLQLVLGQSDRSTGTKPVYQTSTAMYYYPENLQMTSCVYEYISRLVMTVKYIG